MKKFVFKLASVRHHREMVRDREQQHLQALDVTLETARQRLAELERERAQAQQQTAEVGVPSSADEVLLRAQYLERLRLRIAAAKQEVARLERDLATQRQRTLEAEQRLEVINQLGERQRDAHHRAEERETQTIADEMSALRSARSRRP